MFHANYLELNNRDNLTVKDALASNKNSFTFNGKTYRIIQLFSLCHFLSEMIMKEADLSLEHYDEKIKKYVLGLNLDVFVLRCHKDGLFKKIKPEKYEVPKEIPEEQDDYLKTAFN